MHFTEKGNFLDTRDLAFWSKIIGSQPRFPSSDWACGDFHPSCWSLCDSSLQAQPFHRHLSPRHTLAGNPLEHHSHLTNFTYHLHVHFPLQAKRRPKDFLLRPLSGTKYQDRNASQISPATTTVAYGAATSSSLIAIE